MSGEIHIAIVDDQQDQRDRNLYAILHAGEKYKCPRIRFRDVDITLFLEHEDSPFSSLKEQTYSMPEMFVNRGDCKTKYGYILFSG